MNESVRQIFSSHLRYLLARKGKTQADIARVLNVSTATVSGWCNGAKFPRADMIDRLADYLGVRMSVLVEESGLEVLSREEENRLLLDAYHAADPSIQAAVRKLLDIPEQKKADEQSAI